MDHSDDDLPASHPARRKEFGSKHDRTDRNRGGWGEAMELAHQRSNDGRSSSSVVAVDLNQFRNTEVGTGYQAKHVVRQKTAAATTNETTRVVNNNFSTGSKRDSKEQTALETEELLRNDGLRAFRKEIDIILSS